MKKHKGPGSKKYNGVRGLQEEIRRNVRDACRAELKHSFIIRNTRLRKYKSFLNFLDGIESASGDLNGLTVSYNPYRVAINIPDSFWGTPINKQIF